MSTKFEKQIYLAMLAEKCSRYEDMVNFLEEMIREKKEDLTGDERNILSLAYKHIIKLRRHALRTLSAYEIKEKKRESSRSLPYIIEYKANIIQELKELCINIIKKIDSSLLPKASDDEARAFYHKIKGDYYRYIAENLEGDERKTMADNATQSYKLAMDISKQLDIINPIRLGLALNYSVFNCEVLDNKRSASKIAEDILSESKPALEGKDEEDENYKDIFAIVNLIKDNLNMWIDN